MKPSEAVSSIVAEVESCSGHPVEVVADSSLGILADLHMARGPLLTHVIRFNPGLVGASSDYVVAFQCGFILRAFANPSERRFDFVSTESGRSEALEAITAPGSPTAALGLPRSQLLTLRNQLFDGLMTQLRSIPVGLRVDSWLLNKHPDLQELQKASVLRQIRDNAKVLQPSLAAMFPARVYAPSASMNIAYALHWAQMYADTSLALPVERHRQIDLGRKLLRAWLEIDSTPEHDRELVDAWADALGLRGWYAWVPYVSPTVA